ncbi:alanine--tRNA ligase [Actinotignum urinale]|uniref:alanine--tRNA ligase n=1 Tax=Actinotignum urinale TaxID=190146 RepID=UPI0003B4F8ED|nr:alanine--tRNA ligase [Actinotignum urinale]MDY5160293.1 alanine--tRNA ligase [Actinotignum urinale]
MRSAEIRRRWLDYFAKHNHHIEPSVPLVSPDPSILFTIAGMVPFIPYIVGTEKAPHPRVASVQKCIRTNDIDNVGKTTRHGTFFQMCGNFSFGDYFKEGAIDLAFGLLCSSLDEGGYGLEKERMWVTIWEHDDVSYKKLLDIGVNPKHIVKLTREEIFWSTGQPGPAGPCCEIHYDRGPEFGPEAVGGTVDPGGDRYLEVWNLVFDEYRRGEGSGSDYPLLGELDQTAIDTGAGLERIAFLLQGKNNMYETDEVWPVIELTQKLSGKEYGKIEDDDVRMRVIGDHVRSSMMLINDGVRPGNDGRGYVLRRLMRRVVRSLRLLGVKDAVLGQLVEVSKNAMKESYPELERNFDIIRHVAEEEENAFSKTLETGEQIFENAVAKARELATSGHAILPGSATFTLHDTYGFPIDLTLEMAEEKGIQVDEKGFRALMQEQKDRARKDAQAKKTGHVDARIYHDILKEAGKPTTFTGYSETASEAKVVALLENGVEVPAATTGSHVDVILDVTPFYAEAGGQLADHGLISAQGGGIVDVHDVQAPVKGLYVHRGTVTEGSIAVGDVVHAEINKLRRHQIAQAHTGTHMVHKALHEFLGEQATQAGSEDAPSRLRFDFRHGSQISGEIMSQIEARVNERLRENLEVTASLHDIDEARNMGAMMLFGEKYGDIVRVVSIDDAWSREFCGGTHVPNTGEIGMVTILGESSIGSGVRRIEALVGEGAYAQGARERALVSQLTSMFGVRPEELPQRIDDVLTKLRNAEKQIQSLRQQSIAGQVDTVLSQGREIGSGVVYRADLGPVDSADDLRLLATRVKERLSDGDDYVVVITGIVNERPNIVVAASPIARQRGLMAGKLVAKAAKIMGGGGGGKPELAQGGGSDITKIDEAFRAIVEELQ